MTLKSHTRHIMWDREKERKWFYLGDFGRDDIGRSNHGFLDGRPPPRVRATIEEITDEPGSITTIGHRSEKMLLLTWHVSSEPTKEPVCDSVTPRSLPQHDSSTPSTASQVIEEVMRQLSFEETELDGEAGFGDVAESGMESSGLSHDESFGEPIVEAVRTQEPITKEVIVKDYVSYGKDVEQINGQEDESALSDGHFFYDDEGIDSAYETQYNVQSSEDAGIDDNDDEDDDFLLDEENEIVEPEVDVHLFGKDVDDINVDGFDSDHGNANETSNYRRKRRRYKSITITTNSINRSPPDGVIYKASYPKKGEYILWTMKMEQYLAHTDYALCEVILNGNSTVQMTKDKAGNEVKVPPITARQILARTRERKAKSTLLMAIPNEHLARFHGIKDAKTFWAAIKTIFGGNAESRKMY
uniref:Ribonuclease H-like domain-containing protein n=1 Tax=Tanacetum cinerariifolium TaxID=118510 RepID=A0A6L2N866_TANCI|nr:ribonuclease H-like domain-containing protein [Tanacetum cinerariifolium]